MLVNMMAVDLRHAALAKSSPKGRMKKGSEQQETS
jgi:hypothetical protein